MHRWFVQYNPLYLISALCVLLGVYLVSNSLGDVESRRGEIWLALVIQVYELMVIAAAALLYRVAGLRRPAVILGMVEMVYIFDVTFQTEVSAYLGPAGLLFAVAWLALFAFKLLALSWALRLRLSTSAKVLPLLGAASLIFIPQLLYHRILDAQTTAALITLTAFGLAAAVLWLRPTIQSRVRLDAWGATVLRRASRAAWMVWGGLYLGHVGFWAQAHELRLGVSTLCAALLLLALLSRREPRLWGGVAGATALSFLFHPATLTTTALMAAVVLALKARGKLEAPCAPEALASPGADHPYRVPPAEPGAVQPPPLLPAPRRLYVGAAAQLYLSLWTLGWHGGPLPAHGLWLVLATSAVLVFMLVRLRLPSALVPLLALNAHFAAQHRVVSAPRGNLQWGALLLAAGFLLLVGGVSVNWWLRGRGEPNAGE
jgi:hypothetical protein